jgi:hypothetical protein
VVYQELYAELLVPFSGQGMACVQFSHEEFRMGPSAVDTQNHNFAVVYQWQFFKLPNENLQADRL